MTRRCMIVVGVAALVAVPLAGAAEWDIPLLREVTVIGSPEEAQALPGSGTRLTAEDIREQSYDDVSRVLRKVPGVTLREEDGFGLFPHISLRGVSTGRSAKVTIMEDGVLTAPAPYSAPAAYYAPTIGRMSGIEVLKGSGQIRFGPHTTGGVVNMLSTPLSDASAGFIKALAGGRDARSLHTYYGSAQDAGAGRVGFLIELYDRRHGGFKTIDAAPDANQSGDTGFVKTEPMLKLFWEPDAGGNHRFEAKVGTTEVDADETYLGLSEEDFRANPYRRYRTSRFDTFEGRQSRSHLRHFARFGDRFDLMSTVYHSRFHRNWYKLHELRNVDGAPAGAVALSRALAAPGPLLEAVRGQRAATLRVRANNRDYELGGIESVSTVRFETGAADHELNAGVRYHADRMRQDQWQDDFAQDASGAITGVNRQVGGPGAAGNRRESSDALAFHVQDAVTLGRVTVTPGLRFEGVSYAFEDFQNGETGKSTLRVWAPGAGLNVRVTERLAVLGGVFKGFSVPGPRANARSQITEETGVSYELGTRYRHPRGLAAELIGFHTAFDDLIVIDNVGGAGTGATENVGGVKTTGVEAKAEFDAGRFRGWAIKTPSYLAFTYTRARLDGDSVSTDPESIFSGGRDGNRVPYIPDVLLSLGTGVDAGRWSVHVAGHYQDASFTTASNDERQVNPVNSQADARFGKTDSFFIADVGGALRIAEKARLVGSVKNVFDRAYLVSRHPHGPRPGLPRTALAGIEVSF